MSNKEQTNCKLAAIVREHQYATGLELAKLANAQLQDSAERVEELIYLSEEYPEILVPEKAGEEGKLEREWENWKNVYKEYFPGAVRILGRRRLPKKEFYQAIADLIWNPLYFNNESSAFALHYFLTSAYCPYFELPDGLSMENEVFHEKTKEIAKSFAELTFIVNQPFEQRTEQASLINQVFERVEDEGDRAVLMSYFLDFLKRK